MRFCNAVGTTDVRLCAGDTHRGAGASSAAVTGADLLDGSGSWFVLLETEVTTTYPGW